MNAIVREFRSKNPEYDDWTDEQIWGNLLDPKKFKLAFPEYSEWTDGQIRKNLKQLHKPIKPVENKFQIQHDIQRLRQRFPGLPVVIVSHGAEQFSLVNNKRKQMPDVHQTLEHMVNNEDNKVHVCGTHASWYNITAEDYPEFIDVSPQAPAQIEDYSELGYTVITLPD